KILLCCDLARTLLPNGCQPESPRARPRLRRLAQRPEITLVNVSGRHKALIQSAIGEYDLPLPSYAIGDVGTTIYEIVDKQWHVWEDWSEEIGKDWRGMNQDDLAKLLADIKAIQLQEPEKQNQFKLSYYASPNLDRETLIPELEQ